MPILFKKKELVHESLSIILKRRIIRLVGLGHQLAPYHTNALLKINSTTKYHPVGLGYHLGLSQLRPIG
jgi:hypothetical protein